MEQGVHEVPMLVRGFLIVLFVGGCGAFFWGVSHSVMGKQPTPLGWTWFTLLALGLAASLSVAPLTVFLAIVLATLLVTGGIFAFILAVLRRSRSAASKMRARAAEYLRDGVWSQFTPLDTDPPPGIEEKAQPLDRRGFRRIRFGKHGDGLKLVLLRDADGVLAGVVLVPLPLTARVHAGFGFTSILSGRRSVLSTTEMPLSPVLWRGDLLQVFPGATPEQLLENHERAMVFLHQHGLPMQLVDEPEAEDVLEWGGKMHYRAIAEEGTAELARLMTSPGLGEWLRVGLLECQPDIDERLANLPLPVET